MPRRHESVHDLQNPTAALLVAAYRNGVFPMADDRTGRIEWFSPDPRGVLPLEAFHVPRNLARAVRQRRFAIASDVDFEGVMRACGPDRSGAEPTWIDERLIAAYVELFEAGHAHSIEARRDGVLVGGLYGVHQGAAFFGESMFVVPELGGREASKVCLCHLVRHLRGRGFVLLDTQFSNHHLEQFGCIEIDRASYLARLAEALAMPTTWGAFVDE